MKQNINSFLEGIDFKKWGKNTGIAAGGAAVGAGTVYGINKYKKSNTPIPSEPTVSTPSWGQLRDNIGGAFESLLNKFKNLLEQSGMSTDKVRKLINKLKEGTLTDSEKSILRRHLSRLKSGGLTEEEKQILKDKFSEGPKVLQI